MSSQSIWIILIVMTYDASSNDSDDSSKDNNSPKVCINNNRIPSRNWQSPVKKCWYPKNERNPDVRCDLNRVYRIIVLNRKNHYDEYQMADSGKQQDKKIWPCCFEQKQWYKKHGANHPRHSIYQFKIQCQLWSSVFHAGQITRSREELTIGNNMNCNLKDPLEIRGLPKTIGIKHSDLIYNQPEVSLLKYSRSVFHPLWNQSFSSSSFEVLKRDFQLLCADSLC